jgi:DNA modification methylase
MEPLPSVGGASRLQPHYQDSEVTLFHGDCLEVLRALPDCSVDSIVTDPPYGLSFMGKKWDYDVPSVDIWAECLRVLRPGGHLLAFAGTRTQHRMACRIEDAGFDIRDMIAWVYGSGFPKSLDVSKAIDAAGGDPHAWKAFSRAYASAVEASPMKHADIDRRLGIKSSSCYWARGDHRGGMPPRHHWESVRALLNLPEDMARLYDEAEREVVGHRDPGFTPGGNAVYGEYSGDTRITAPATEAAKTWEGWGTALKPALEPITMARKPLGGTVAETVLAYGTGAINVDGCRVEGNRWPANLAHDGGPEVVGLFPGYGEDSAARFFYTAKASKEDRDEGLQGHSWTTAGAMTGGRAEGSAGLNNPRAGAGRTSGGKNIHPTVKPTALMQYLCRLVTPPGGLVLDPFMGSGSTGKAALLEGFRFTGIEREADYLPIAKTRVLSARRESVAVRHIDLQGSLL